MNTKKILALFFVITWNAFGMEKVTSEIDNLCTNYAPNNITISINQSPKTIGRVIRWNDKDHPRYKKILINTNKRKNNYEANSEYATKFSPEAENPYAILDETEEEENTEEENTETTIHCIYSNCSATFSKHKKKAYNLYLVHLYKEHKTVPQHIKKCIKSAQTDPSKKSKFVTRCPYCQYNLRAIDMDKLKEIVLSHCLGTIKHNPEEVKEVNKYFNL